MPMGRKDAISERLFGKPRRFQWLDEGDARIKRTLKKHRHRVPRLTLQTLVDAVGIPNGATIRVGVADDTAINLSASYPAIGLELQSNAVIADDDRWRLILENFRVASSYQQRGLATRILLHALNAASHHGFQSLALIAVRDEESAGYLVWPLLGFDGEFPSNTVETVVLEELARQKSQIGQQAAQPLKISDLLAVEFGRAIWEEFGDTVYLEFDLTRDSLSWQKFEAYSTHKSIALARGWPQ